MEVLRFEVGRVALLPRDFNNIVVHVYSLLLLISFFLGGGGGRGGGGAGGVVGEWAERV